MKQIGIIGGSGYTAGELIRILINHPQVELNFVYSRTYPGKPISSVHTDLTGQTELEFTDQLEKEVDVLFLCLGHGKSREFLEKHIVSDRTLVIDLSTDFRSKEVPGIQDRTFVYGLPELNKEEIVNSKSIANPGCFATAIQLALLPLSNSGQLIDDIHVHAITGSTGAGIMPSTTTHFSWRNNNVSWYKPFVHQHEAEIIQSLEQSGGASKLRFLPIRGDFPRGIYATSYTKYDASLEEARELYEVFYQNSHFTKLAPEPVHLKQVINTNYCHVHLHKHEDQLLVTSVLDNLMKGASGQAIENMNLALGFPQDMGLRIKASVY